MRRRLLSTDRPKHLIFAQFASLARALGHEHRLQLLEQVAQGPCAVERLAERTTLTVANASQHLQVLRRSGLVQAERSGKQIFYRLADGPVVETLAALRTLAEHNVEEVQSIIDTYFARMDTLEPIGSDELLARLSDNTVTLIDVRPRDEFEAGHIAGAVNIEPRDLKLEIDELPRDREIVAYCRGPYCVLSFDAVRKLRALGRHARRFEDGLPEWRAAGFPVEIGVH